MSAEQQTTDRFGSWCILELMGHRRLAGYVTEEKLFGVEMARIDIPSDPPATQYYGGSAIYCLTPTIEATARLVAQSSKPEPVQRWELPAWDDGDDCTESGEDDDSSPAVSRSYMDDIPV